MQLSLGSSGERHPRPLPAKIAQAFLDVRSVTLILTYTLKSIAGGPNHESDRKKQQEIDARKSGTAFTLDTTDRNSADQADAN